MFQQRRGLIIGGGGLLVVALLWLVFGRSIYQTPRIRKVGGVRTHEINRSRVEKMNVNFDGVPFGSQVHEVKLGQQVQFSGTLPLKDDMIPTGRFAGALKVVHNPVGTDESVWSKRNSRRQWGFGLLRKEREFDEKAQISPELFSPGDYELRAYLQIRDAEGEDDAFDYLGSARMKVISK